MRAARYLAWAGFGAAVCWAATSLVYRSRGPAMIDFAVDPPPQILSGVYDAERTREGFTWVWSRGSFSLSLEHVDRSGPWRTTWRLAAQRADAVTPELVAAVDGVVAWRHTLPATGFVEEQVDIPALAAGSGRADRAVVTMTIAPTFVPGSGDNRTLGAQIDYVQDISYESKMEGRALDVAGGLIVGVLGLAVIAGANSSYNSDLEWHNMDPSFFAKPEQPTGAYAMGGIMAIGGAGWLIYSLTSLPKGPAPVRPPTQRRWTETHYVEAQGCGLVPADRAPPAAPGL